MSIRRVLFPDMCGDFIFGEEIGDINAERESPPLREGRIYRMPVRASINSWDDVDFFARFRLSKRTFLLVLSLIGPRLQHPHSRPRYITPEQQLLITLRFMASGSMQLTVADVIHVSAATVSRTLPKVCMAIIEHLPTYVNMPATLEERNAAAAEFYRLAEFPRTIGAIDCTHVKIQSPGGRLSEGFRNRKGYFSLNVQTISSADLKVNNIVARWAGSMHDQTIFRNSAIRERFEAGDFGKHILVGDSGYANTPYLATPFTTGNQEIASNRAMQIYQAKIIKTRNVVERQYGVLKRRFPVLAYGMRVTTETAQKIIVACAILQNICIEQKELQPAQDIREMERLMHLMEESNIDEVDPLEPQASRIRRRNARDEIINTFVSA